jgi:hypothetical protein
MPNCIARYSDVGVLPQRETPTRITSARPSSRIARRRRAPGAKLIGIHPREVLVAVGDAVRAAGGVRALRAELRLERPDEDLEEVERKRVRVAAMLSLTASSTIELNTIAGRPSRAAGLVDLLDDDVTLSGESTNGIVMRENSISSNCDRRLLPSISAVMPVRSETKKTVRRMGTPGWPDGFAGTRHCRATSPSTRARRSREVGQVAEIHPAFARTVPVAAARSAKPEHPGVSRELLVLGRRVRRRQDLDGVAAGVAEFVRSLRIPVGVTR